MIQYFFIGSASGLEARFTLPQRYRAYKYATGHRHILQRKQGVPWEEQIEEAHERK